MTTHPTPDPLTLGAAEPPAGMASVLFRLGAALELLPQPIAICIADFRHQNDIQVSNVAAFEAWRQWLGAPEVEPGPWHTYEPGYHGAPPCRIRERKTWTTWRGQTFTVVLVEMAPAEAIPNA